VEEVPEIVPLEAGSVAEVGRVLGEQLATQRDVAGVVSLLREGYVGGVEQPPTLRGLRFRVILLLLGFEP